ncbi:uncharacterized protein BT62DRAFT_1001665 [Guyanagaster necrorhizus]|uniref:UvrD-like helicase ATP-binding domain-containing protein n=1 Tax=Guyanagaster necrorhizus TaxID=856835 RepID=A0A9P7W1V3_9AGAR|nr:uncharacterized protein BT62DRAFT_1001665 [Guyanagaster necrorhizus MCA 3950]KAG7450850.1 hypothetical protein BT62DRAFT_1001665 [Guyanagaster necrorhizus MCA 3950]
MSPKQRYRSDLFSPEKFASGDLLDRALEELRTILTEDNFKHVFQEVIDNESARILFLVLSCSYIFTVLSETTSLISWLLETFPSEAINYDATVHCRVISCLSAEFISSSFVEEKEICARYHEIAQIGPKVLKSLVSFLGRIAGSEYYKKGKAQISKFQQTKGDGPFAFVKKDFDILKIDIPETSSEASVSMDHVLQSQKDTLKFYLELLRRPEIYVSLKERCIVSASLIDEEKIAPGFVVELPSAYPNVQPMKSALYFDTAEGFGEWTVVISTDADNFLRSARKKNLYTFNITMKKIKELSCGHFTNNNQKPLSGSVAEVPVFEAKITRDLRLVYQIDLIPGDEYVRTEDNFVIRVTKLHWFIGRESNKLSRFLVSIRMLKWTIVCGVPSAVSCKKRENNTAKGNIFSSKRADSQASKNIFIPAFFPPLPEVLQTEIEDIPDLRPDETVEVHSRLLFEKYITFSQPFLNTVLADVDATFPHMVSTQEKRIIEHPKSCYVIGRSGTGKTTTMLFKMLLIERTFQLMESDLPRPRQVFITKSRVLAKKVQEYFVKLSSSLTIASQPSVDLMNLPRAPQYHADLGLVHADDIADWRIDLPAKYSDLKEKHFPLFITFDGLCDMLEADMGIQTLTAASRIGIKHNKSHMTLITFESFCESYWSHFPQPLIKGSDPALVYSEIIGVIKGSAKTLSEEKQHLSRATYLDLSERRQSTFADQRPELYKLFELYMHKKKLRGEYDTGDRTHRILKYFAEKGVPGQGLDHLYVDEVQDNMLIDSMVLRALCNNADGLFWAGDTAQTISVGSSFRFEELKAFQWNIEDQYRRRRGLGCGSKQLPEMFQLAVNYRSHAGIVDCAHSIIDLIMTFWEDCIDRLSPEMGIVDGVKPIFFNNEDHAQLEQFLFLDGGGAPIEFGAQQCIIVRNETARERLQQKVGKVGLVLTIYESKGLEFNDVLLYNFFADSPTGPAQWRVVLNAIEESKQDPRNPPPRFDYIRHANICSELKCLYVAITRARENIWIADGSETGEPMRIFWNSKNLINNFTPGSDVPRLASESTPEEWAAEGRELFNAKHFSQAKRCYRKANLPLLASIADAYDSRMKARNVVGTSRQKVLERRSCFAEAAKSFSECADFTSNSRDFLTYFRISGECFEQADEKNRAAEKFLLAQEYTRAAELYRDIDKFDEAVVVVKGHGDKMLSEVVEDVIKLARLTYFSNGEMTKAHQLFDSFEEEVTYLKERDLDVALAHLLEMTGRISEAAELHCSNGRKQQAIELFLREAENKRALCRAQECILDELWHTIAFDVDPNVIRSDLSVLQLMHFASQIDEASVEWTKADELSMFRAIIDNQTSQLRALGSKFHKADHSSAALLCLDQYFSRAPRIQDLTLVDAVEELGLFYTYAGLLSAAASRTDPWEDVTMAAMFGFRRISENEFLVSKNAWLQKAALNLPRKSVHRDHDSNLRLSAFELRGLFQFALRSHLKGRIAAEDDDCAKSQAFQICLVFAESGRCDQCPQVHMSPLMIDTGYYNMRVRLHLQQILILGSLSGNACEQMESRETPEFWLNRLCDALYPPHHMFGSISYLVLSTIPEAPRALDIMTFVPDVIRTATIALMFDRSQAGYLRNPAYISAKHPPSNYVRQNNGIAIHNLLSSMSGDQTWSLTAGFLFVELVVKQRLSINVGDLCDFVDFLCGSVILWGCRSGKSLSSDLTVPRSWLLWSVNYDFPEFNEEIQTDYYRIILAPMQDLLEQLHTRNCDHLFYVTARNHSKVPCRVYHDAFILRIFKALGLLGHNVCDDFLRVSIQKLMLSLRQEGRLISPFYNQCIDAADRSWDELVEVIRSSLQSDPKIEMIQLVHLSKEALINKHALQGVHQRLYVDLSDIQQQLCPAVPASTYWKTTSSQIDVSERKGPDKDGEVEKMKNLQEAEAVEETSGNDDVVVDAIPMQEAKAVKETSGDDAVAADAISVEDMTTRKPTEREVAAASLIQRVCRKVLRHRRGVAKRGTTGLRAQFYASCTKKVTRLGANPGLYLRLFLGPLPHLLVCLENVCTETFTQKTGAKKRFLDCSRDEMEAVEKLLKKTTKANQAAIKLRKQLDPSSAFHESCNSKELRKLAEEANDLISSLPFKSSLDLSDDLHLAIKGIVTQRSSTGSPATRRNIDVRVKPYITKSVERKSYAIKIRLVWDNKFEPKLRCRYAFATFRERAGTESC